MRKYLWLGLILLVASGCASNTSDKSTDHFDTCPPITSLVDPSQWELAPRAFYQVNQFGQTLRITADGTYTAGDDIRLAWYAPQGQPAGAPASDRPVLGLYRRVTVIAQTSAREKIHICARLRTEKLPERVTIQDHQGPQTLMVQREND